MAALIVIGLVVGYGLAIAMRLGVHHRVPLMIGPLTLESIPDRAAGKHGDRLLFTSDVPCAWDVPALRARYPDSRTWSAVRIKETVGYVAAVLRDQLGVTRGDRVALLKTNHLDIHILHTAIVRAGGIACPLNGDFPADNLYPYLMNIGADVLVSDVATLLRVLGAGAVLGKVTRIVVAERRMGDDDAASMRVAHLVAASHPRAQLVWLEEALAAAREEMAAVPRDRNEPMYLVHSSGTTGFPKAVILRNGAQSHAVRGWLGYVHLSRTRDKGYVAAPHNHQAVILTFNGALLLGLPVHWSSASNRGAFDAVQVIARLAEGRFTGFFAFPIAYTQLKEVDLAGYDLRRMRFWACTADASHEAIQRHFVAVGGAFRSLGWPLAGSVFLDAQGSSEVGTPSVLRYVTRFTRTFDRRVGRPGSTPFGPAVRIARDDGRPVRDGHVGRLAVKGKTVFDAYWNNHTLTADAFRGEWFFTGDMARRGRDGHIVQLDREVDVIRTRRGDVYSLPIEEEVDKHPAVFDACVYGARQRDGSQAPVAAIALRAGVEIPPEALLRELNERLSRDAQLELVEIIPWNDFPIGITGKTLKRVFRARTEPSLAAEHDRPAGWSTVPDASTAHHSADPHRSRPFAES